MNIKNLASSIMTKLILGFILAAAIVIAIVYFLQLYHVYLLQFSNGAVIETVTYTAILIGSGVGIYFLLAEDKPDEKTKTANVIHPMNIENLGLQFLDGFLNGLGKRKDNSPPTF
jgi:uncharacterized membrane protein YqiK